MKKSILKNSTNYDGWMPIEDFLRQPTVGTCWISYKGNVRQAYRSPRGIFLHYKYSSSCYLTECIKAVMPIAKPDLPDMNLLLAG